MDTTATLSFFVEVISAHLIDSKVAKKCKKAILLRKNTVMPEVRLAGSTPIDAVITWVDGSDYSFSEKLKPFLNGRPRSTIPGASLTRFASVNEIKYCVLSILTFAPFIRKIFIVTDNQNPKIFDTIQKYYPDRLSSIFIVDHKDIFSGYEEFLPTFSSRSIESMIWRIDGLSNNFVYFNDDNFLVRPVKPSDWFVNSKPVLRGKWTPAPILRLLWYWVTLLAQRHLLQKDHFEPRPSFHIGQWFAARLSGYVFRYFANSHTPHTVGCKVVAEFLSHNQKVLTKNIMYKFRNHYQFNFVSLSNHLQIKQGNKYFAKSDLVYMQPVGRPSGYIDRKIACCIQNPQIKFLCVQSLEQCSASDRDKIYSWMDSILNLDAMGAPSSLDTSSNNVISK
jgi:hypothetical protein